MVKHGALALHRGNVPADRDDTATKKNIGTSRATFAILMEILIGSAERIFQDNSCANQLRESNRVLELPELPELSELSELSELLSAPLSGAKYCC